MIFGRSTTRPRARAARGAAGFDRASLAAGLLLIAATLPSCQPDVELERIGAPDRPFVAAEVPGDIEAVTTALREFFNDGLAPRGTPNRFPPDARLSHFELVPAQKTEGSEHVSLPYDHDLRNGSPDDPAMDRYLALPPAQRAHDLYLYEVIGDFYWRSEYAVQDQPVEFQCEFLLHLAPAGPSLTRIEVIEVYPHVWLGKKWAPTAHGVGFGKVYDLRKVAPTVRDRVELLDRIVAAVAARQAAEG